MFFPLPPESLLRDEFAALPRERRQRWVPLVKTGSPRSNSSAPNSQASSAWVLTNVQTPSEPPRRQLPADLTYFLFCLVFRQELVWVFYLFIFFSKIILKIYFQELFSKFIPVLHSTENSASYINFKFCLAVDTLIIYLFIYLFF